MKKFMLHICLVFFLSANYSVTAQGSNKNSDQSSDNILETNTFYDYDADRLTHTDTIPGFETNQNKLKISGTIYKSDGVTPAKDVILYIEQADENGNFDVRKKADIKYVYNRGWIKTDSNGNYTFYTYIPGNDRRYNQMQMLFPIIKEPSKPEYEIATFLFDEDPLLSKLCRKRLAKKGDISRILKLKKENGLFVTHKNIILQEGLAMAK